MKKIIFLSLALISTVIGASASIVWTTECGVEVVTVGPEAFDSKQDANEYYQMLNEIFCGPDEEDHGSDDSDDNSN